MGSHGFNLDASVDMSSVGATNGSCGTTISDFNTSVDVTSRHSSHSSASARSGSASSRPIPYELSAVVGSGKYSTVYRATRIETGEVIAVKKVQVFDMDTNMRSDCITEVKLLQVLGHPHVIKYMNSYIVDNELIIELEFAEGGDLGALIAVRIKEGRPFEEEEIWTYFIQIVDAAKHMHDKRMMHRDIKPSNIFITRDGILKLGDFGLSRHFSSQTKQACSAVGTPYYMSPEVIRGLPYDWSSDVWSLGCLLYELAALRNPFFKDGLNFYQLGKNINNCQFDPLPPHLSEELRALTSSMIQQDPQQRPSVHAVFDTATQCLEKVKATAMQQ